MAQSPDDPMFVIPRLYAIIDPAQGNGRSPVEMATTLLAAGVRLLQLRDKHASSRDLYASARLVTECVHQAGGIFIVNDRADVALAVQADGVHLGQDDFPADSGRTIVGTGKIVGYSTHNLEQLREADRSTADYIAFGPIFSTASKANPDATVGLAGLAEARRATRKPLVAIGGITLENAREVIDAGADSIAVIRGLVGATDIGRRAEEFLEKVTGKAEG